MKRFTTKIIVSILTFGIGLSAVIIWLVKFKPDSNVYSVEFCDLMRKSKAYDSKIIEIQASYVQGYEASFLTDSNRQEFVTATCFLEEKSCRKVFDSLDESLEKQEKVTVIGRYHNAQYQTYDGYVHTIEILEIKPVNTLQSTKAVEVVK